MAALAQSVLVAILITNKKYGVTMDISDYSIFFRHSLEMLCIADSDGKFVELNPRWSDTLGYSNAELKAKPFIEFVHPKDVDATLTVASELFSG